MFLQNIWCRWSYNNLIFDQIIYGLNLVRYSNGGQNTGLPFEYRTSEYQTTEFLLFRCSLFRCTLRLNIFKMSRISFLVFLRKFKIQKGSKYQTGRVFGTGLVLRFKNQVLTGFFHLNIGHKNVQYSDTYDIWIPFVRHFLAKNFQKFKCCRRDSPTFWPTCFVHKRSCIARSINRIWTRWVH